MLELRDAIPQLRIFASLAGLAGPLFPRRWNTLQAGAFTLATREASVALDLLSLTQLTGWADVSVILKSNRGPSATGRAHIDAAVG